MSVTILEGLMNAEYNAKSVTRLGIGALPLAIAQLHNAIVLLGKGYGITDKVEPLLERYGEVENVPEKE